MITLDGPGPVVFREGPSFLDHMRLVEEEGGALPSIVLLDINMPRLNGFEILQRLRSMAAFAQVPAVIFLSNSDSPRDMERCASVGAGFQEKLESSADCVAFFDSLDPSSLPVAPVLRSSEARPA